EPLPEPLNPDRHLRRSPLLGEVTPDLCEAWQRVPDDIALAWLECWNGNNNPPLPSERLVEILADAHRYGTAPYGSGLQPQRPPGRGASEGVKRIAFFLLPSLDRPGGGASVPAHKT